MDESGLAARTKSLFGKLPAGAGRAPRRVAAGWSPRLPLEVPLPRADAETPEGRLSASAIDEWLGCPFAYLLKTGLGMERTEEKDELGADDFGTIVHKTLERYAREQLDREARGLPQFSEKDDVDGIAADVAADVRRVFAGVRARYGARPPLKLRLQLDAAQARLGNFAGIQARWAADGWRIAAKPEFGFCVRPFAGEGDADVWIKGSVDRIDYNAARGVYRLIDYKTWDAKDQAAGHVLKGGAEQVAHAESLGLPATEKTVDSRAPRRILSVQLPLYGRCLEALPPSGAGVALPTESFAGRIGDYCYLVLGRTSGDTGVFGSAFDEKGDPVTRLDRLVLARIRDLALQTARTAVRAIRGNLFWPPGPGRSLDYGLGDILLNSPESDLEGTAWLAEQRRRLAAFKAAGAAHAPADGKARP